MEIYQKLFKNNRFWEILVKENNNIMFVKTKYGIVGGKIQETIPQKFEKKYGLTFINKKIKEKIRNGYVKEIKIMNNNKIIKPMGSSLLEKNMNNIIFPANIQPKLDGFRGISFLKKNIEILSKNGISYRHLENIKKELSSFPLIKKGYILDGEIYIHNKKLGNLKSVLGRKKLDNVEIIKIQKKIKYCIFDIIIENISSEKRIQLLKESFKNWNIKNPKYVKLVKTTQVNTIKDIINIKNKYLNDGYEGVIVRNKNGLYKLGKKSKDVFRTKEFKKDYFKIVDALEGKGNEKGTVIWKLECLKDKNKSFTAKPIGSREERKKIFKNRLDYIGKKIYIKYFDIDNITGCVSRHPIALHPII